MIKAPDIITTPMMLKFGEVFASAKVKRINPTTRRIADMYSCAGYFRLSPGIKAPITITGRTCTTATKVIGNTRAVILRETQ